MTAPTPPRRARQYRCNPHVGGPIPTTAPALRRRVQDWMDDMIAWAQDVRDDIIRLEAAAGLPMGDPADPPPRPWR